MWGADVVLEIFTDCPRRRHEHLVEDTAALLTFHQALGPETVLSSVSSGAAPAVEAAEVVGADAKSVVLEVIRHVRIGLYSKRKHNKNTENFARRPAEVMWWIKTTKGT